MSLNDKSTSPESEQRPFRNARDMIKPKEPPPMVSTDAPQKVKTKFRTIAELIKPSDTPLYESAKNIPITQLVPYAKHPFMLYEGERLGDMIRSIRDMGVLSPIIVRPQGDKYEILSGHNRANAASLAGLTDISAIVRENISDELATLIVTETNLVQRSFDDLRHSEKAIVLKHHLEAIKAQGKRKDILDEIRLLSESMEKNYQNEDKNPDGSSEKITSSQIDKRILSVEKTGKKYGLSPAGVARCIRLNHLHIELLNMVDEDIIPFNAGVELSYIPEQEQTYILMALNESHHRLDIKKSKVLRELSASGRLTPTKVVQVLSGDLQDKGAKAPPPIKIRHSICAKYFAPDTKKKVMEQTIDDALELYFARMNATESVH